MKTYTFYPQGVCSRQMDISIDDDGIVRDFQVIGGCNGNLQGIGALIKGMKAEEVMNKLEGILCGTKGTSCPDQLAKALRQISESQL